jgi:hypothetical protein
VNRLIPDAEIEDSTDTFARRIAGFDKVTVVGIKKLVDVATLPESDEFAPRAAGLLGRRQQPQSGLHRG